MVATEHPHELPGSQDDIHIRIAAGIPHRLQRGLLLFGEAGHDGDDPDLVGIQTHLLGEVGLGDGAEHLLGTLGSGEVVGKLGVVGLDKPHPAGAAGGEHGPLVVLTVGEALHELAALLHNGQVGAEVGVEYIVKAQPLEGGDHLSGGGRAGGQAELLSPGHPHRRGYLDYRGDLRIRQGVQHILCVVPLTKGTCGTVGDALSAESAVRLPDLPVVADVDGNTGTSSRYIPDIQPLDLVADLNAAHALDALALLADQRSGTIPETLADVHGIGNIEEICLHSHFLQGAIAIAHAEGALTVVLGENQTQVGAPGRADLRAVGIYHHALLNGVVTGGDQSINPFYLHHTYPAGADLIQAFPVAQTGDGRTGQLGSFQEGSIFRYLQRLSINGQSYHFSCLPPLNAP